MSKTYSFSLNNNEVIEAQSNLGITSDDLGKAMKALILKKENSGFYPKALFAQKLEDVEKEKMMTMQERASSLDIKGLEKVLGIKGKNADRKIKAGGLYYKKNFEDYVADFVMWWNGDKAKAPELILKLQNLTYFEHCANEYAERKSLGVTF